MSIRKHPMILAALATLFMIQTPALAADPAETAVDLSSPAVMQTKMAVRDMWVEHIFWIRNYVLATKTGDEAQRKVAETEIVDNAKTIAASIEPFYGEAASSQLFDLLAGHWGAVQSYNDATFEGSADAQKEAVADLTSNAREIAKFLSGANPNLPEDTVFGLYSAHGAHHVAQIDAIEAGEYAREAETWTAMRKHMFVIADALVEALAKQFPEKFEETGSSS